MALIDSGEIYQRFFNNGNGIVRIHVSDIDNLPTVNAMVWKNIEKEKPENNTLYLICTYSNLYKRPLPADSFARYVDGKWYWWVEGDADEVESKVTHFAEICFPD